MVAELVLTNVFTLRDGRIVNVELYRDREDALEAAGLREQRSRGGRVADATLTGRAALATRLQPKRR